MPAMLFSDVFRKRIKLVLRIYLDRGVLGGAVVAQGMVGCCWVLLTHNIGFVHSTASAYIGHMFSQSVIDC